MESHFSVWKMVRDGKFGKWLEISDGHAFSSSENGPSWAVTFQSGKWPKISDEQAFSSSENGPDRTVIFIMKMVRWIVDVP